MSKNISKLFVFLIMGFVILSNLSVAAEPAQDVIDKNLGIEQKIKAARLELDSFFRGADTSNMVIVIGSHVSIEDKLLFNLIHSQVEEARNIPVYTDKQALQDEQIYSKTIILLGSERTNYLSNEIIVKDRIANQNSSVYEPLAIKYGYTDNNQRALMLYSLKEVKNNENRAISASPLNKFMDEKYIPYAATAFSIILLFLWKILIESAVNVASDYIAGKTQNKNSQKRTISEKKRSHHQRDGLRIHQLMYKPEIIALILSIIVFSAAVAWTWTDSIENIWITLLLSLAVVGIIATMKEVIRQNSCYTRRVCSEYIFWPFGAALTLISTYLGNTFSLASYDITDDDESDKKNFGRAAFAMAFFTFMIAIIAYLFNIFYPSFMLQLIFVYAIMSTFIDLFPVNPMPGADIRRWNFFIWILFYVVVIGCYIFMNFTTYI